MTHQKSSVVKLGALRTAASVASFVGPVPERDLSTREKIILLESSKLNGYIFPPWIPPKASDFDLPQFTDTGDLSLSEVQLDIFDDWRRPTNTTSASLEQMRAIPTMLANETIDLVQDVTSDCSVVASLCAATARLNVNRCDLIVCNVYPWDSSLRQPAISPNGKYVVRMFFNGCFRKVTIDDRLPTSRSTRILHVVDRNNPGLIWPALVEKAYLKIRGGYDFPGSNSGTDLWVMTGWIPEQLFIQSDDVVQSTFWRRVFAAFSYGDVLVTVGTGKLTQSEEDGMGLIAEHDYAILDMKERRGQQYFLVKNPWAEGTIWKGHACPHNATTEVHKVFERLLVSEDGGSDEAQGTSLAPGTFWMGLNDVFQNFEYVYLNWNPGLFSYRTDVHFRWDLSTYSNPEGFVGSNPQYVVRSAAGGTVWLLLDRHFTSRGHKHDKQSDSPMTEATEPGFINLCAFDNREARVVSSDNATYYGPYVDSPNTLLKVELPAQKPIIVVASEQALDRSPTAFTLSAFSLTPLCLFEAQDKFTYSILEHGTWTAATAGGNASSLSYYKNPQFSLHVAKTSDLFLLLQSSTPELPIHVKLVWAKGKRIQMVTSRDIVGDSGEYRKAFAFADLPEIQGGLYTIVCSTFEQGQIGDFTLEVRSMASCALEKIPISSAGRFITKAPLAVFSLGNYRLFALLTTRRLNRVLMVARSAKDKSESDENAQSHLRLSIEHGQGHSKQTLGSSDWEEYSDGRAGAHCQEVDIHPNMCDVRGVWVVVERLECPGLQDDEYVQLDALSDAPIEIQGWNVGMG